MIWMQGELEENSVYFNRTMKNLPAIALCVMAFLGAGLAGARINFDAAGDPLFLTPIGTLTFSKEALGLGGRPDEQGFYIITSPGFDTVASLGKIAAYVAANSPVWVRYDASGNLKLRGSAPALRLSQGGDNLDINPEKTWLEPDFFLYKIPANDRIAANMQLQLNLSNNLSLSNGNNGLLMVRIYRGNYLNAIRERSNFELLRRQVKAAGTASSIGVEFTSGATAIADAATEFSKFLNDMDTVPLGAFEVNVFPDARLHLDTTGQFITAHDLNLLIGRSSTVSFSSAAGFAFADFTLAEENDCSGAKTSLHYRGSQATKAGPAYASLAIGERTLCVTAREASDSISASRIPEATYLATVEFSDAREYHLLPGSAVHANFGRIKRNGTTVQLLLNTHENYNDRIIIVNRANIPANYDLTFHAAEGVRAIPGAMASGTLAEKTTTLLRARDVVTLNGGTLTAATLSIVLSPDKVDVMTQRVNLIDSSIDAIHYPSDG